MSWILFYTIQCLLYCEFCNVLSNAKPVVGTIVKQAKNNEFPSVVSIGHRYYGPDKNLASMQFCTGTLVTTKHVLTAAHCLDDVRRGYIQVFGGSPDITKCDRYEIKDWLTYNDWADQNSYIKQFQENDLAIITLREEVNLAKLKPALVSFENNKKHAGLTAAIAGWGKLENNRKPKVMNTASVDILKSEECARRCSKIVGCSVKLGDRFMCSAGKEKQCWLKNLLSSGEDWATTSLGDSGGPLLYNNNVLLAVNIGVWPPRGDIQKRMNYHIGLNYYKHFLDNVIPQGLTNETIHT